MTTPATDTVPATVNKVLVTSSRMPFALDEIRKLGRQGLRVFAADTFAEAPGSHSKYVAESLLLPSPRYKTGEFIAELGAIIASREIDLVLPTFEEALYIARYRHLLPNVPMFMSPFSTILGLHDKRRFIALCQQLSIAVPRTVVASDREQLVEAASQMTSYFARAAFSRGGVQLLTNTGPLAGALPLEECTPTAANPWLVQEFVEGVDYCTLSVCHHGRVAAHSTYVHPKEIEHAGGIVFESVVDDEILAVTQRIATHTAYHGQMALDFRRRADGMLVALECNPRATNGVLMMSPQLFFDALLDRYPDRVLVAEPGVRSKMSVALIRDMLLHLEEIPRDLVFLLSNAREVYAEPDDLLPGLYQLLSYKHVIDYRRDLAVDHNRRTDLMAAYFYDICWDGEGARC